jgi:cation/acetate symporter
MQTIQTGPVGAADGNLAYDDAPDWFSNWEKTGLLVFEDKNSDGKIQYYGPGLDAKAAGFGWEGNEMVKVDRDIMVLANPEIAKLPNWVIALVAAGGIAAALSTAAGLLLAIASAISHDLLKGIFTPNITEKTELMASRIAMAGAIILAGVLGLNPPGFAAQVVALAFGLAASSIFPALMMGIFNRRMNQQGAIGVAGWLGLNPPGFAAQVVALAFGLAASSIFPALMMGIFNKKVNRSGAIWGMISGIGVTMLYVFQHKGIFFVPGTAFLGDMSPNWFFGISPNAFGAIGALVNFTVAITVSKMTAPPPEHIQHLVEDIRVPKGASAAVEH